MKKIIMLLCMLLPTITYGKITDENIKDLKVAYQYNQMASLNYYYIEEEDYIIYPAEQVIFRFDKNTYELKTLSFGNWDTSIVPYKENYLVFSRTYDGTSSYTIAIIDKNFNILEQKKLELNEDVFGTLYNDNGTIYLNNSNKGYYIIDNELNLISTTNTPNESEYLKIVKELRSTITQEGYTINNIVKSEINTYYVIALKYSEDQTKAIVELREYNSNITLKEKKELYNGETENSKIPSLYYYNKKKLDKYYIETYGYNNEILINIVDEKNNIIKEIKPNYFETANKNSRFLYSSQGKIVSIEPTQNGFLLVTSSFTTENEISAKGIIKTDKQNINVKGAVGETYFMRYEFDYMIDTKTDGNGTITSEKIKASNGEEIKFTIEAKEGYELTEVKVTDKSGNVITLTDNTFTMPSSNVTIEAVFKEIPKEEKNPNTSDYVIITSIIIIVLGTLITYININKMKELL